MSISMSETHELAAKAQADAFVALGLAQAMAAKLPAEERAELAQIMEDLKAVADRMASPNRFTKQIDSTLSVLSGGGSK